jgi:hypothetical protein
MQYRNIPLLTSLEKELVYDFVTTVQKGKKYPDLLYGRSLKLARLKNQLSF